VLDAVNLGWKLAYKLRGFGTQELLETYHTERHYGVNQVIENDKIISTLVSGQLPPKFAGRTEPPREILDQWFDNTKVVAFTLGLGVSYQADGLLNQAVPRGPLSGLEPGERAPDCYLSRLGTNERVPIQRIMPNDATFYITLFAGVPYVTQQKLANLRSYIDKTDEPTWANSFPKGIIKLVTILGAGGVAAGDAMGGLKSFGKTYYDATQEAHQSYGGKSSYTSLLYHLDEADSPCVHVVDPMQGALIVIRPDGYIGHVVSLDQPEALLDYFRGFLLPVKQKVTNGTANGH
jgi:phenol 2-monooxygenase